MVFRTWRAIVCDGHPGSERAVNKRYEADQDSSRQSGQQSAKLWRNSTVLAAVLSLIGVLAGIVFPVITRQPDAGTKNPAGPPSSSASVVHSPSTPANQPTSVARASGRITTPRDNTDVSRCASVRGIASTQGSGITFWLVILVPSGYYKVARQLTPDLSDGQWDDYITYGEDVDSTRKDYHLLLMYTDGDLTRTFRGHLYPDDSALPSELVDNEHILDRVKVRRSTMGC